MFLLICQIFSKQPYVCTICGRGFNQKNNLSTHIKTHNANLPNLPFTCGTCGHCCKNTMELAQHIRFHMDAKPLICSLCNLAFMDPEELNKHVIAKHESTSKAGSTDTTKPTYTCNVCQKSFSQSNNLKTVRISIFLFLPITFINENISFKALQNTHFW